MPSEEHSRGISTAVRRPTGKKNQPYQNSPVHQHPALVDIGKKETGIGKSQEIKPNLPNTFFRIMKHIIHRAKDKIKHKENGFRMSIPVKGIIVKRDEKEREKSKFVFL